MYIPLHNKPVYTLSFYLSDLSETYTIFNMSAAEQQESTTTAAAVEETPAQAPETGDKRKAEEQAAPETEEGQEAKK